MCIRDRFSAGSAIFRSCGNSRYPMVVSIISNLINVTGNAILMFGLNMGDVYKRQIKRSFKAFKALKEKYAK